MFSISEVTDRLSKKVSNELDLDEEKRSVINYGMFALIQMMISIFLVLIFGTFLGVSTEALIVSFTVSILRKSSGGVHANTPEKCAIVGTVSSIIMGMLVRYSTTRYISIGVIIIIFIISFFVVYRLAPVDSASKPIKKIEKRNRLRNISMMILMIYLIIICINFVSYKFTNDIRLIDYSLCICLGVMWQVFSLTKSGHLILGKIDNLLEAIKIKRG